VERSGKTIFMRFLKSLFGWRRRHETDDHIFNTQTADARLAYFESCATIVLSRGVEMNYDHDKVDEMVLALLYLTISEQHEWGARAWKSHDWDALDRLHTKGYISDPKSKAKSVVLNAEGVKRARELFEQHFGR
jgi:Domain of unknown function (DUF6429)